MGRRKYWCPYCEVYLKKSSAAVVERHNAGVRHLQNYAAYWEAVLGEQQK